MQQKSIENSKCICYTTHSTYNFNTIQQKSQSESSNNKYDLLMAFTGIERKQDQFSSTHTLKRQNLMLIKIINILWLHIVICVSKVTKQIQNIDNIYEYSFDIIIQSVI